MSNYKLSFEMLERSTSGLLACSSLVKDADGIINPLAMVRLLEEGTGGVFIDTIMDRVNSVLKRECLYKITPSQIDIIKNNSNYEDAFINDANTWLAMEIPTLVVDTFKMLDENGKAFLMGEPTEVVYNKGVSTTKDDLKESSTDTSKGNITDTHKGVENYDKDTKGDNTETGTVETSKNLDTVTTSDDKENIKNNDAYIDNTISENTGNSRSTVDGSTKSSSVSDNVTTSNSNSSGNASNSGTSDTLNTTAGSVLPQTNVSGYVNLNDTGITWDYADTMNQSKTKGNTSGSSNTSNSTSDSTNSKNNETLTGTEDTTTTGSTTDNGNTKLDHKGNSSSDRNSNSSSSTQELGTVTDTANKSYKNVVNEKGINTSNDKRDTVRDLIDTKDNVKKQVIEVINDNRSSTTDKVRNLLALSNMEVDIKVNAMMRRFKHYYCLNEYLF